MSEPEPREEAIHRRPKRGIESHGHGSVRRTEYQYMECSNECRHADLSFP